MAKYLAKIKKIKQNWATSENFGICFDISFECCDKNWSLDGRLDIAPLQLHKFPTQIRDFFFVSIFISIFYLSFSLFSNSWCISNTKLTLLDIKFRFTYSVFRFTLKHRKLPQYFVTNCRYDKERAYKPINTNQQKKHKHARKIIWCSTPFRKSVSTKVRKPFLSLLVLHYPKNYTFSKNYNRDNTQSKQD